MTSWYLLIFFKVMQGEFTLNFPLCLLSVQVPFLYDCTPKIDYYNKHTVCSALDPTLD